MLILESLSGERNIQSAWPWVGKIESNGEDTNLSRGIVNVDIFNWLHVLTRWNIVFAGTVCLLLKGFWVIYESFFKRTPIARPDFTFDKIFMLSPIANVGGTHSGVNCGKGLVASVSSHSPPPKTEQTLLYITISKHLMLKVPIHKSKNFSTTFQHHVFFGCQKGRNDQKFVPLCFPLCPLLQWDIKWMGTPVNLALVVKYYYHNHSVFKRTPTYTDTSIARKEVKDQPNFVLWTSFLTKYFHSKSICNSYEIRWVVKPTNRIVFVNKSWRCF